MGVAKVSAIAGLGVFFAGALGLAGSWATAVGSVVLLVAAIAGAVALEARDAVAGLVEHDLGVEPVEAADDALSALEAA